MALLAVVLAVSAAGCTTSSGGARDVGPTGDLQQAIYRARDRVMPAVVTVYPVHEVFRAGQRQEQATVGSGAIFSADGLVLTNHHVIADAARVECLLSDRRRLPAEVLGSDPSTDIAVLRLSYDGIAPETRPVPARLGRSTEVRIGDVVLAMGTPSGLTRSVSVGVVSSTDRSLSPEVNPYHLWVQTDAAISPGNSGGPLVNLAGEIIGVNARKNVNQGVEGIGFAVPIDVARRVAFEIVDRGQVVRAWLGVSHWQALEEIGRESEPGASGLLVGGVSPGGAAARAGLRAGDIVTAVDGRAVSALYREDLPSFREMEAGLPVGKPVALAVRRGEEVLAVEVVVEDQGRPRGEAEDFPRWGLVARELTEPERQALQLPEGMRVRVDSVVPNGPAARRGLGEGLLLERVGGRLVSSLADLREIHDAVPAAPILEAVGYHPIRRHRVYAALRPQEPAE